jgi:IS30 family transposase
MSNPGRPRVLDDLKRRDICTLISAGCGMGEAARYVGCSVSTIRREILQNEEFKQRIRGSELCAQLESLRAMRKASATHWRAAAWMLERTNPRRFAKPCLKSLRAEDIYSVIKEVVECAADEIKDAPTRHRVCRRLIAAAHNASRALGIEDPTRCDANPAKKSTTGDSALDEFLEDLDRDHRQALRHLRVKNQNPLNFAPRAS